METKFGPIDGVRVVQKRMIPDDRGTILHGIRSDEEDFEQFAEAYFSEVHPGVVKGWHIHKWMSLNYVVPVGKIKLVLYDNRPESKTYQNIMEIIMCRENYVRVTVPPGVYNGFKGLGTQTSLVLNVTTHVHDPAEIDRADPRDTSIVPYDWFKPVDR